MRIAIDLRWISKDAGGIRQYVLNLASALKKIDKSNDYMLIFDGQEIMEKVMKDYGFEVKQNFKGVVFKPGPFSLKNQFIMKKYLKNEKVDVFHSPDFIAPVIIGGVKLVITMHDIIPYLHPELCMRSKKVRLRLFYKLFNRIVIRRAEKVITDSESSRRDIIRTFRVDDNKVKVIYLSAGREFKRIEDMSKIDSIKKELGLAGRNILYVGRQEPSKNLTGVIRAFYKIRKERGFEGSLVIAGKRDDRYPEPYNLVESLGLNKRVIFTGFIEKNKLPLLYNACNLFIYPSYYEGFGLPPIEAMACGLPVIASIASSLPEVIGDGGIMVHPDDINGLAKSMDRVLKDSKFREALIEKGLKRAALFSWENAAKKTLAVYEEVIKKRQGLLY